MTGDVTLLPVLLFLIIFLWTPPHFWALALYRTGDYDRVGVPMLPVVAGRRSTLQHILAYTVMLVAVSLLPTAFGLAGLVYGVAALGLWVPCSCGYAVRLWRAGPRSAGDAHVPLLDRLSVRCCLPALAVDRAVQDLLLG